MAAYTTSNLLACTNPGCPNYWGSLDKGDVLYMGKKKLNPLHIGHAAIITHRLSSKSFLYAQHTPNLKDIDLVDKIRTLGKTHHFWVYQVGNSYIQD